MVVVDKKLCAKLSMWIDPMAKWHKASSWGLKRLGRWIGPLFIRVQTARDKFSRAWNLVNAQNAQNVIG
jgi:hypothetical protein